MTDNVSRHFDAWWEKEGKFLDPDTDDVPWFDKRKELAAYAFRAAMDMSGNYVADDPVAPGQFTFVNGRVVRVGDNGVLRIGKTEVLRDDPMHDQQRDAK